jgi:hypothetical protein
MNVAPPGDGRRRALESRPLEAGGAAKHPPPARAHPTADGCEARTLPNLVRCVRERSSEGPHRDRARGPLAGRTPRLAALNASRAPRWLYASWYRDQNASSDPSRNTGAGSRVAYTVPACPFPPEAGRRGMGMSSGAALLPSLQARVDPAHLARHQRWHLVAGLVTLQLALAHMKEVGQRALRHLVARRPSGARPFLWASLCVKSRVEAKTDRPELLRVHWGLRRRGTHTGRKYSDKVSCRQERKGLTRRGGVSIIVTTP